jgi:uncharacterized protein YndB with AHSA1/START domain
VNQYEVEASALIAAPPDRVYAFLADYRNGHPQILPPEYFHGFQVEHGGAGSGTVVRFAMSALGTTRTFRAIVTEPEPGRVLAESYPDSGALTTFTVDPGGGAGQSARVTISTVAPASPGLRGAVEGWMSRRYLRKVYRKELALLAERLRKAV